jgi:hypothetical protein
MPIIKDGQLLIMPQASRSKFQPVCMNAEAAPDKKYIYQKCPSLPKENAKKNIYD